MTTLIKIAPPLPSLPLPCFICIHYTSHYFTLCYVIHWFICLFLSPFHNLKVPWKHEIAFLPLLPQHLEEWQHGKLSAIFIESKRKERVKGRTASRLILRYLTCTIGQMGMVELLTELGGPGLGEVRRFIIFRLKLR